MNNYNTECLYKDTYTIIEMMDSIQKSKISKKFIKFLIDNKDDNFEGTINPTIPLKEQELRYELKLMLSLIYINYFCDDETKEKILKEDDENIKQFYSKDIFYNSKNNLEVNSKDEFGEKQKENFENEISSEEKSLIQYKSSVFSKIINFIKNIFSGNKS